MNLPKITNQVVQIAKEAGAFIRKERNGFDKQKVELKGKSDLVSYVDKEAEKMLVQNLGKLFDGAGFLTEEETTQQETKEYTWIIDPLDGTTNFVHGIPNYCVSIALMHQKEIVSGVTYEVANDECFFAWQGGGAYLNNKKIQVNPAPSLSDCVFATGFPINNHDRIEQYLAVLGDLIKNSQGLRRLGSAAADLAYVACGRYGGFFEYNLSPWDVAAGILLVREAGGTVSDFSGGSDFLFGKEIVAAGAAHTRLLTAIENQW